MEKSGQKVNGAGTPTGFVQTPPPSPEKRVEMKTAARAAAPPPPANPFAFVDELPIKVRELVESAAKAKADSAQKHGDRRYLEGMRRGAFLISMGLSALDSETKQRVLSSLTQLEEEIAALEKGLRT